MENVKCPKCEGIHTTTSNVCEVCGHHFTAEREQPYDYEASFRAHMLKGGHSKYGIANND